MGNGQSAKGEYEFSVVCGNTDLDGSLITGVSFDEWVDFDAHTKVWYSSTENILPVLQEKIKTEKPGLLFINGIYSWPYNLKPLLFCKGIKKIISARGMLHPGALSQKSFKKKIYLFVWKLLGLHKKNIFHATDEQEKLFIQQVFGQDTQVKVAANFPGVLTVQPVQVKEPGRLNLVSIALLSPMKNILLVLEALAEFGVDSSEFGVGSAKDEVLRCAQDDSLGGGTNVIAYHIYGPVKDATYWAECEAAIKKLPANITVLYHGDIPPAEIEKVLAQSHVFILPSKSENFGHAIFEALTAGRPVITSQATPWNDLQSAKAGINVSVNETSEIVQAISFFAALDQVQMENWSMGARAYADQAVDREKIMGQYEEMFGSLQHAISDKQ